MGLLQELFNSGGRDPKTGAFFDAIKKDNGETSEGDSPTEKKDEDEENESKKPKAFSIFLGASLSIDKTGRQHAPKGSSKGGQFVHKGDDDTSSTRAKLKRVKLVPAKRVGEGKNAKIVLENGKPAPKHVNASMVPPNWQDVFVNLDPKSDVIVKARDEKGRVVTVYTKDFRLRNAAVKLSRVDEMIEDSKKIDQQIQAGRKDPKTREAADCAWLMSVQATRPGSPYDTGAETQAYGATTLEGRHVVQTKKGVYLRFTGKKGVHQNHLIRDEKLAKMLVDRAEKAGKKGQLFNVTGTKLNEFVKTLGRGGFKPKDFRTRRANLMAVELIKTFKGQPKTKREYKARVMHVAEKVSEVLGNRPAEALKSYINPAVFSVWQMPE